MKTFMTLNKQRAFSFLGAAVLILASAVPAHADNFAKDFMKFEKSIQLFKSQSAPAVQTEVVYDNGTRQNTLPDAALERLQEIAREQSNIWADTILEGQYEADGKTQLDQVEVLRMNGELLGFRIVYSEQGWYTGDCDYDTANKKSLESCQGGRITEASFVSADMKNWMRDDSAYAEFSK